MAVSAVPERQLRQPRGRHARGGPAGGGGDAAATATCSRAWTAGRCEAAWAADSGSVYFTADDQGRRPVFRAEPGSGRGHPAHHRRRRVRAACARPRTAGALYALRAALDAPPAPVRLDLAATRASPPGPLAQAPAASALPGALTEVTATAEDGASPAGLAGAARRRLASSSPRRCCCGCTAARDELERLVVAVEPVADGRPRVRRAAARPGPVHRLRPRVHRPRARTWGDAPFTDAAGDHRRGRRPAGHRRGPDGDDGRLVRRLHGQLDRRPHRPVPRDRQPRRPVVAGPDVRHHRHAGVLAADVRRPVQPARALPGQLAAQARRPGSARRC